jgi:hypothetical protein
MQPPAREFGMGRSSLHNIAQASRSKFRRLRPGVGTAIFGVRVLVALAMPPLAFAQEPHPPAQPSAMSADESAFLSENDAAMTKMMNDMAAKPTGDIDRDFVAMMTPHHQGAIDMAVIELRYGKNEQLQEIAAMKLALGEKVTDTAPAPTQPTAAPPATANEHHHPGMQMDMSNGMKK